MLLDLRGVSFEGVRPRFRFTLLLLDFFVDEATEEPSSEPPAVDPAVDYSTYLISNKIEF